MAAADEHDHLPFGPGANVLGVQVKHADEAELETEPEQLHDDPEQEVALEDHLSSNRIFPKREVYAKVT